MSLDWEGNCTHLQVRKAGVGMHGGDVLDVWKCADCEQRFVLDGQSVVDAVDEHRKAIVNTNNTISVYRSRKILSVQILKEQWYLCRSKQDDLYFNSKSFADLQDIIDMEDGVDPGERDEAAQSPDDPTPPVVSESN